MGEQTQKTNEKKYELWKLKKDRIETIERKILDLCWEYRNKQNSKPEIKIEQIWGYRTSYTVGEEDEQKRFGDGQIVMGIGKSLQEGITFYLGNYPFLNFLREGLKKDNIKISVRRYSILEEKVNPDEIKKYLKEVGGK